MRVLHVCLSCFYIDGYGYQENELVKAHVDAGHEVYVLASTESYDKNGLRCYLEPSTYMGSDGALVTRLPYSKFLPHAVMKKLRFYPGVYEYLGSNEPDVILFHGLCAGALLDVRRYKVKHPAIKLYIDSHEDYNNSARNLISKYVLHMAFYRTIIRYSMDSIERVLCVSLESIEFCKSMYGISDNKIEFFPLGGRLYDDESYIKHREVGRHRMCVTDNDVVFLQTGKLDKNKMLIESLECFSITRDQDLKFIIAGVIDDLIKEDASKLIEEDCRIKYLGWQSRDHLMELLCAADVYVQPGSQSATMQWSICARCALILDDVLSHQPYLKDNGWLVKSKNDLCEVFKYIENHKEIHKSVSDKSEMICKEIIDYQMLSRRLVDHTYAQHD
ncbi:MAG: glycosyltransferase [Pseudomonadota bacterium]